MPLPELNAPPATSKLTGILIGIALAAPLAIYALLGIIDQTVYLPGKLGSGMQVTGGLAVLLSLAYLSGAALLHFHFFWGTRPALCRCRFPLVLAALFSCAAFLLWFVVGFFLKTT